MKYKVCRVGPSKKHPGQKGIFLNKKVAKDAPIAVYVAPVFRFGDPRISADNSYQMMIPGTNLVMDAAGIDESVGKAQFLNDSMDFSTAEVKLRQAPGGYTIASLML